MEFNKRRKFIIKGVYDKETQKSDDKYSYRVGRKCYLQDGLDIGKPVSWQYENGLVCTSPKLTSFEEDDYGVFITTEHRIYDFEYYYENDRKEVEDKGIEI